MLICFYVDKLLWENPTRCAMSFSFVMIYDLSNEWEAQNFIDKVKYMVEKNYVVTLSRKMPQRSMKQNNYLYLLLSYFSSESGYSIDEVKIDYFKKTCNPDLFYREKQNRQGKTIQYLRSSSELDVSEMNLAITRFRNWSSAQAGIYLPSPEDHDFILHCEKEIERNKEYLYT